MALHNNQCLIPTHINDLNKAIINSYVHHFEDDANLLHCNKSLKN